jgi:hypothetical protein
MGAAFLKHLRAPQVAVVLAFVLSAVSCGGKGPPPPPPGWVLIQIPPASQTVPIGWTAAFAVTAAGPNLTYQWTKNGAEISGATSSSYTTPTVSSVDSGTQYAVTVTSDAQVSETSTAATLTAGPRAPATGDVRYLLWEQGGPYNPNAPIGGGQLGQGNFHGPNVLGTPLSILTGPPGAGIPCVWTFSYLGLPTSMNGEYATVYDEAPSTSWQSYLASLDQPNIVLISMDLESVCGEIGVSYMQATAGGFDYKLEEVAASGVNAAIAADASASRIVTAVTFDSQANGDSYANEWLLVSYGWQGDTSGGYDSQTAFVPNGQLPYNQAATWASEGYFVTAFGGNYATGYLMVAMRQKGDTMPRRICELGGSCSGPPDNAFSSVVVYLGGMVTEQ